MDNRTLLSASVIAVALAACGPDVTDRAAAKTGAIVDKTGVAMKDAGKSLERAAVQAQDVAADAAITASIKADLLKDPDLSAIRIEVDTRDGIVTLNGLAPSDVAVQRAAKIAAAVAGVKDVRNHVVAKKG